jgi:hypothetical protein
LSAARPPRAVPSTDESRPAPRLCGVWRGRRGLSAVLVDEDGSARQPLLISTASPEARWELLEHIDATEGLDWQLVLPQSLARADPIARFALARDIPIWVVPNSVVEAVTTLGRLDLLPAGRIAAALARLPSIPFFRRDLRRLEPPDRRQLDLL